MSQNEVQMHCKYRYKHKYKKYSQISLNHSMHRLLNCTKCNILIQTINTNTNCCLKLALTRVCTHCETVQIEMSQLSRQDTKLYCRVWKQSIFNSRFYPISCLSNFKQTQVCWKFLLWIKLINPCRFARYWIYLKFRWII